MKNFIINYKIQLIIALTVVISILLGVAALTSINVKRELPEEFIEKIGTCSKPTGEIVCKGIDVSSYQLDIDFKKVKADGYDFVILRAGTGKGKDRNFETYYKQAKKAGLDIGCYFYSYASTVEDAEEEAKTLLTYIEDKEFTYPVFYDFEESSLWSYDRVETNTKMINAFCKLIKFNGYYPGVYTSSHIHRNYIDQSIIDSKWDVWIANYGTYSGTENYEKFSSSFSMWQYSDRGSVDGISTNVDMNVCFVDYPSVIAEFNSYFGGL